MRKAIAMLLLFSTAAFAQPKGTLTDARDKKAYKTVKIGYQTWMAENLNYNASGSKCYENNPGNCAKYGRLYNWATAMALPSGCNSDLCSNRIQAKHRGICPNGWHIPSDADWDELMNIAGEGIMPKSGSGWNVFQGAGRTLKAKSGWNSNQGKSGNGTDEFGFSALPGGYWNGSFFGNVGIAGYWWSSSEEDYGFGAYYRGMVNSSEDAVWFYYDKPGLFSVRCVRD